ncbi:MAG: vitamin K epoxide reductase family protein [Patescibacteria group bacterium]
MKSTSETVRFSVPRISVIVIAILGLVIMGYLFSLRFSTTDSAFCNLGENLSCDVVNKSAYATIWGIPLSLLGFLYFLGVGIMAIWKWKPETARAIAVVTIIFLGPSLYLSYIEFFVLENICVFCEASKILMIALLVPAFRGMEYRKLSGKAVGMAVFVGLLLAFITYAIQSRTVPEGKYDTFAQCLTEKSFVVYGSATCSYCATQRAMFGSAFQFIKEIECNPRNPHPETQLCIDKNIEGTPTWIQEDASGKDVYRFPAGVVELDELSRVSGCALPEK